jgi:hypothetical protein
MLSRITRTLGCQFTLNMGDENEMGSSSVQTDIKRKGGYMAGQLRTTAFYWED